MLSSFQGKMCVVCQLMGLPVMEARDLVVDQGSLMVDRAGDQVRIYSWIG
jgi:uncharacterized circularly permuted ATP-grasp superfamily protein